MRRRDGKLVLSRGVVIALAIAFLVVGLMFQAGRKPPFWAGGPAPTPASAPGAR